MWGLWFRASTSDRQGLLGLAKSSCHSCRWLELVETKKQTKLGSEERSNAEPFGHSR